VKRKRTLAVCALILTVLAGPAFAIFGFGDIVFDPSNFEESVQQLLQMQQQYAQLVQTYLVILGQYEHMIRMAERVPVNMAARYRALATSWRLASATNTYGTTDGWIAGINSGVGVAAGYARAIEALASYGSALANVPADQLDRLKKNYATVELSDGSNLSAIETIGRLRANSSAVETAIQNLEDDSLSSDPSMNTEIAVLNKINAANLIAVRNAQDANKLLVALTEAQVIDVKRKRDAEAKDFNDHIRFMTDGRRALDAQASGASAAMLAWRMP